MPSSRRAPLKSSRLCSFHAIAPRFVLLPITSTMMPPSEGSRCRSGLSASAHLCTYYVACFRLSHAYHSTRRAPRRSGESPPTPPPTICRSAWGGGASMLQRRCRRADFMGAGALSALFSFYNRYSIPAAYRRYRRLRALAFTHAMSTLRDDYAMRLRCDSAQAHERARAPASRRFLSSCLIVSAVYGFARA